MSTAKHTMDELALRVERAAGALAGVKQAAVVARDLAATLGSDAKKAERLANTAKHDAKKAKRAVNRAKSRVKKAESKFKDRAAREAKKLRAEAKLRKRDASSDAPSVAVEPEPLDDEQQDSGQNE